MNELKATIDFETRSAADLLKIGAYKYAKDDSTRALCLAYELPGGEVQLWHRAHPALDIPESPPPLDLFEYLASGGLVEAHNSFFEWAIWSFVCVPQHGWPSIKEHQWRCSAAKASAHSLPRGLEGAALAMHLSDTKDAEGGRLMKRMCKPLPKSELCFFHESVEDLGRLWEYCKQDVRAECALSDAVPDLSPSELRIWQLDQKMNKHGAMFDLEMARSALDMATQRKDVLNERLLELTGVTAASQRAKISKFMADGGINLIDTRADTLRKELAKPELPEKYKEVLRIVIEANRTSNAKYAAMLNYADPGDWRIRDLLMYHGAGPGRWAGKGVQVHNFPSRNLVISDPVESSNLIKEGDVEWVNVLYGDVMQVLSSALRAAIIAPQGRDFMIADYTAIEARVVLWLAGAESALEDFRAGTDIYCGMASDIYGKPINKVDNPVERSFGKQAILGLGYGMGFVTFFLRCRASGIIFTEQDTIRIMGRGKLAELKEWINEQFFTRNSKTAASVAATLKRITDAGINPKSVIHELAAMKYSVDKYRAKYPQVVKLWRSLEASAIQAAKGTPNTSGHTRWFKRGQFLYCELPSGRLMAYCEPSVKATKTPWGDTKPSLRYMSVNSEIHKWASTHTYGGKLVENVTQATARDIMAYAMVNLDDSGIYQLVMTVHDEIVCEVDSNKGSLEEFERLMVDLPEWAKDIPCDVEVARVRRYCKL